MTKLFFYIDYFLKYRKNSLNFKKFEPGIKDAIRREKDLEEDITKIKNELGTHVGLLVNKMIKEK